MTRTARVGSKTTGLSSTPWVELKKGYKLLEPVDPQIDVSDIDSDDGAVSSGSGLGVSKEETLKMKKKKEKVADKVKKMTRKELEDTVPLLSEVVTDEVVVKKCSKKKPTSESTPAVTDSSISAKRSKKKPSTEKHEQPEDKIPLLSTSTDDSQIKKTKATIKRTKSTIKKTKPESKAQPTYFDERRQKRIEARRLRRQRRKVCFNCRESGHHVSECTKSRETTGTGICFKCGADSHSSKNCRAKVSEGEYPYAKCFVCGEVGHLSRACPENPKGLYPHGGSCNLCGSVEHFKSNCPTRPYEQRSRKSTVGRLNIHSSGSVDAEDFEVQQQDTTKTSTKTKKSRPKVVKF